MGEVADVFDGTHQTPHYMDSGIMFLSVENIGTLKSEKFISKEDFSKEFKAYPEYGDVLMTRIGDIGTANVVQTNDKIAYYVSLALLKPKKTDSYFLVAAISSENMQSEIWNHTLHVAFPKKINKNEIARLNIKLPTFSEQTAIGNFFRTLDDTITLHKRKLDTLKELKRGYLQQMFPQVGESVPRIRFAGFTEPWQVRKLGDVVERVTRKNKGLESPLVLTISAQHGLVAQKDFFEKEVASKDLSNYYLVKNGEFAYNKSYSNGYPWGAVKRLDNYEMGVLSTLYIVFKPVAINSEFLVQYFETTYWHNEVAQYAAEGARNHGLLNIATSDFFDTLLAIPTNINEQGKIGDFFQIIDKQILDQEQKFSHLKQLKLAYLQKMLV